MRSTEGAYFSRLDHVRALAAYLVFVWHFLHLTPQFPLPYASAPVFPFALFDEGHTGVALFMTLSGYLFAKLAAATLAFVAFLPVAALSYRYFEKRFLAYRRHYLRAPVAEAAAVH